MAEYKVFGKSEYQTQSEIIKAIAEESKTEALVLELIRLKKPAFGEISKPGRKRKGYKVNPIFAKFNGR
jgi:hypothetical protein